LKEKMRSVEKRLETKTWKTKKKVLMRSKELNDREEKKQDSQL